MKRTRLVPPWIPNELPKEADYKKMIGKIAPLLVDKTKQLDKIEGLIAFGIGISKHNFRKVAAQFTFSTKLTTVEERCDVVQQVLDLLPTIGYCLEFETEFVPKGKYLSYGNERIKHER